MRRQHLADGNALPFGGMDDPVGNELAQRGFIGLLQLAAAAFQEMAARGRDMMRPGNQRPIGGNRVAGYSARDVAARCRDAVTAGGDPFDDLAVAHRNVSIAVRTARASSPAVKAGPARRAAS